MITSGPARPSTSIESTFDVVGIGNALVDIISQVPDEFLAEYRLTKGRMELIDPDRAAQLYNALDTAIEMSGGSAANTMCGVASLGGRAGYIGKVSDDELGDVFGHDLLAVGVRFSAGDRQTDEPTGISIIVVTPDAERTMNTSLGASSLLATGDLDEAMIAAGSVLYMEGYLFDRDDAKAAYRHAAQVSHDAGRLVSLTLSDSFCVDRHRADFLDLVDDEVDLLFCNEAEVMALYEVDTLDAAIAVLRQQCPLAAVTVGAEGSTIVTPDERFDVPAVSVDRVVDTTGAGDLFAAGFLFGFTHGRSLADAAEVGSMAAAEVISHVGPRPLVELRTMLA